MKINKLTLGALFAMMGFGMSAQDYTPKYQIIDKAEYPTKDVFIAAYNILDYDAEANKGEKNVTDLVQTLLDKLGEVLPGQSPGEKWSNRKGGGVLYLPEGVYKIDNLIIPRGVTLRGDWKQPVKGEPIKGTILAVTNKHKGSTNQDNGFIIMEPTTLVEGVAIWYEDQNPKNVSQYPPSIVYGRQGYWGNDYCNVRDVTLVNSYIGLIFSEKNGGGCPNIFGLYGTPLHKGVAMDNIADVGRFDHIDFSPDYWKFSGLKNAGDASDYIYNHGIGFEMRRNDWSYCCNFSAEGYNKGFWAKKSPDSMANQSTGSPNGHNYNLVFTNCKTGVYITESAGCGIMFTRVKTPGCEIGLEVAPGDPGPAQFLSCDFSGSRYGVYTHTQSSGLVQMELCKVTDNVSVNGGEIIADKCTFSGDVTIGALARSIFTANTIKGTYTDNSMYQTIFHSTTRYVKSLPAIPASMMEVKETKPARLALYNVEDFGAKPEYINSINYSSVVFDNTPSIQAALDKASADGGGIVYLPSGHYQCSGNLTIPTGVELRGSSDIASVPRNQGAILEVYAGKGSATGTPFITMQPKSGLRGVSLNYPEQDSRIFSGSTSARKCKPYLYPYAVRGNADCYIVNLSMRACYQGLDLFTNKCDNHYVDYLAGHAFKNVIRIGGNSQNGTVSNIQFNTIVYAAGHEWKFGHWPNSVQMNTNNNNTACYTQNYDELDFFILGDCKTENLYNNFLFGSNVGMHFISDGNGGATFRSLGNAVDGVVTTFLFEAAAGTCDLINTQLVALNNGHSASFLKTESTFNRDIYMFGTNNWGGGDRFVQVKGGTVHFILANLEQSGTVETWSLSGTGKCNMVNANIKQHVNSNATKNVSVNSAIFTPKGNGSAISNFGTYANVLPRLWKVKDENSFLQRGGWHVFAFNDPKGQDANGNETLSGSSDAHASRAIDSSSSTRWSTNGSQKHYGWYDENNNKYSSFVDPQYYAVYFNYSATKKEKINAVILDSSVNSSSDGPAGWLLQVIDKENGKNGLPYIDTTGAEKRTTEPTPHKWRDVASGKGAGGFLVITFDPTETTGFRVVQTGAKSNYWSIEEINATLLEGVSGVEDIEINQERNLMYIDRQLMISSALFGSSSWVNVEIYDMSGRTVASAYTDQSSVSLDGLEQGIYVARATGDETASLKFMIK